MRRYQHHNQTVEAIRYQPCWPGHTRHRLSESGVHCLHLHPVNQSIELFSSGGLISITDPRHDFESEEGVVYPGDWIVWRTPLAIEIVPSRVFDAEYAPLP